MKQAETLTACCDARGAKDKPNSWRTQISCYRSKRASSDAPPANPCRLTGGTYRFTILGEVFEYNRLGIAPILYTLVVPDLLAEANGTTCHAETHMESTSITLSNSMLSSSYLYHETCQTMTFQWQCGFRSQEGATCLVMVACLHEYADLPWMLLLPSFASRV